MHDLAASKNPVLRFVHDQLTYIDPQPHREIFLKPFHREQTPEFCSSCHKVHLDVPVNAYRWFRGFNDYDNWQASGVSGLGARSFYYPPKPQKCADCHMQLVDSRDPAAKNGKVRSHRFAAANTALPFVNKDPVQLKAVQDFLRDGQVTIDIFGLARGAEAPAPAEGRRTAGGDRAAPVEQLRGRRGIDAVRSDADLCLETGRCRRAARQAWIRSVRRGESVRLDVVVRTRKVGHFFPAEPSTRSTSGSSSKRPTTRDACCFTAAPSKTDGKGPVEPGAHFYRSLLLDEHGNRINKRNAWAARSVAYVRLIPPGAADTIHYRLQIPAGCGRPHFPEGEGELPQIRVVEHAVGIRRRQRPAQTASRSDPDTTTGTGCLRGARRTSRARSRRSPTFRSP